MSADVDAADAADAALPLEDAAEEESDAAEGEFTAPARALIIARNVGVHDGGSTHASARSSAISVRARLSSEDLRSWLVRPCEPSRKKPVEESVLLQLCGVPLSDRTADSGVCGVCGEEQADKARMRLSFRVMTEGRERMPAS